MQVKTISLKGRSWRASPEVKELLLECKQTYKDWLGSGKLDIYIKKNSNVVAKRALRKQLRKEKIMGRKSFYEDLMKNPTSEKFYHLIRRNKGARASSTCSSMYNGSEIRESEGQRKAFAQYYEDLSRPKDNGYDSAFLELCTVRHKLIERICNDSTSPFDPITDEVYKAMSHLN